MTLLAPDILHQLIQKSPQPKRSNLRCNPFQRLPGKLFSLQVPNYRFTGILAAALVFLSLSGVPIENAYAQSTQGWPSLQTAEWTKTDFEKMSVDPGEIMSGGPPRDGIPPIDEPVFGSIEEASEWLEEDEPVIAFVHEGDARAYPLQIMLFHEIVNDIVGEKPFSVTFCPLCNASIVFDRQIEDRVLDFGTTGRLRKSDLIMYDRQTETWWQQFTGTGIIGEYVDVKLRQVPSQIVSFAMFADSFPQGQVLSRETGYRRQYGQNPYSGYDSIDNSPFLYSGALDPRLPPMERILSVPDGDSFQLVPLTALQTHPVVQFKSVDTFVVVLAPKTALSALDKQNIAESRAVPVAAAFDREVDGTVLDFELRDGTVLDLQTGSEWNAMGKAIKGEMSGKQLKQLDRGVHFAFAWLAFDPQASIYSPEK